MKIEEIRKRIAEIDQKILDLLQERYRLGEEIALTKLKENKSLWIPEVEMKKLNNLPEGMNRILLNEIFSRIMQMTREGEYKVVGVKEKIGVLGPEGSFSDEAGLRYAKSRLPLVHFSSFGEMFDSLERGEIDKALAPIENSKAGTVMDVIDELLSRNIFVTGEFEIPIRLCLAGYGTRRIISHPKAIEQCSKFLSSVKADIEYSPSTAKALEMLDDESSAICSEYAAISRGIPIIRKNIQDHPSNTTRFVVVEREMLEREMKNPITIFVFWVKNRPGALRDFLDVLASKGINLRKLESKPSGIIGDYMFISEAEDDLRKYELEGVESIKILGVYERVEI